MTYWIKATDDENNSQVTPLISDHFPQKLGDTVIWNVLKDSNLDAVVWSIAKQLADKEEISAHMLQEVPIGREAELIKRIQEQYKQITTKKIALGFVAQQNLGHPFSNLTLFHKDRWDIDKEMDVKKLNTAYKGQALITALKSKSTEGQLRIMVNVHADFEASKDVKTKKRISINALLDNIRSQFPTAEIVVGGDFNKGESSLKEEVKAAQDINHYTHHHSTQGSNYSMPRPRTGAPQKRNVDAFYTSGCDAKKFEKLTRLDEYNHANTYAEATKSKLIPGNPIVEIKYTPPVDRNSKNEPAETQAVVTLTCGSKEEHQETKTWVEENIHAKSTTHTIETNETANKIIIRTTNPYELMEKLSPKAPSIKEKSNTTEMLRQLGKAPSTGKPNKEHSETTQEIPKKQSFWQRNKGKILAMGTLGGGLLLMGIGAALCATGVLALPGAALGFVGGTLAVSGAVSAGIIGGGVGLIGGLTLFGAGSGIYYQATKDERLALGEVNIIEPENEERRPLIENQNYSNLEGSGVVYSDPLGLHKRDNSNAASASNDTDPNSTLKHNAHSDNSLKC